MEMVTVASYLKVEEAYLAASLLESCEIPVFVKDAHTVQMHWFYSNAIGGAKVQVPATHLEEAKAILGDAAARERDTSAKQGPAFSERNLWPLPIAILILLLLLFSF